MEQNIENMQLVTKPFKPESTLITRSFLNDYELKHTTDHWNLNLYLTIDRIYMQNMMQRRKKPRIAQ